MNPYTYQEYFNWLLNIVEAGPTEAFSPYHDLLTRLFQTPFKVARYMDDNREVNGRMLRYYFDSNKDDYASHDPAPCHIDGDFYEQTKGEPCSILEMMIAFAKDIDTQYLYSTNSRVFIWFWTMIEAMGLSSYTDGSWDTHADFSGVDWILRSFNLNAHQIDEYGNWIPTVKVFPIRNLESFEKVGSLWEQMQVWYNEQIDYLDSLQAGEFINYYTSMYMYG